MIQRSTISRKHHVNYILMVDFRKKLMDQSDGIEPHRLHCLAGGKIVRVWFSPGSRHGSHDWLFY
jgi:hypothetical protein